MRRFGMAGRRGPALLGTKARTAVVAGTASTIAGGVRAARRSQSDQQAAVADIAAQQEALAQQQQWLAMQEQAPPSESAVSSPSIGGGLTRETIALLQPLGELQSKGILTPEEFARQKAKILGS